MKYLWLLVLLLWPCAARAATCQVPYIFVNGTIADATQVNANFTALTTCGNAVDNTNLKGAVYASQIRPGSIGQATFGGTVSYTFRVNVNVTGAITVTGSTTMTGAMISSGYTQGGNTPALLYTQSAGATTAAHVVFLTGQLSSVVSGGCGGAIFGPPNPYCTAFLLSGSAVFSSGGNVSSPPSFTCGGGGWNYQSVGTAGHAWATAIGALTVFSIVGQPTTIAVIGHAPIVPFSVVCYGD